MKFKTTTNGLKKALGMLHPVVNHNHSTLGMRYLLMRRVGEKIEFKAFNDFAIASVYIDYYDLTDSKETSVFEAEKVFILAKHFVALINSFNGSEITINTGEGKCSVKCGKSNYKLKVLDQEVANEQIGNQDFDYYGTFPSDKSYSLKVADFSTAYNSVSHCVSKDSSNSDLQNLCIDGNRMITCDGFLSAVIPFESSGMEACLHKKACECILNLDKNKNIELSFSEEHILGKSEDFVFITTAHGDFPLDRIEEKIAGFDLDSPVQIEIDPDEIVDKLNRLLMFANAETSAIDVHLGEELQLIVDGSSYAKEVINMFKNIKKSEMVLSVDGKSLKEALNKSLSKVMWHTSSGQDMQYIHDGTLLQFFYGLD